MPVEITVIKSTSIDPSLIDKMWSIMPEWFQVGGVVMWLLLLTSFIVTTITLERLTTWGSYFIKKEHFAINDCFAALNKKEKQQALLFCKTESTPALNMLRHGINTLPFSPQKKMDSYARKQISKLSQGQSVLGNAAFVALMLGLLGATLSLIESFANIAQQQSELLSAISSALIPLAFAFAVALLAFIPYKIFQEWLLRLQQHLLDISSEFSHICQQNHLITNKLSEIMKLQEQRIKGEVSETTTRAEQSEMPYHYEFKEGSDEVNVSLHSDMQDLHKTSQSSIIDMYKNELEAATKNKKSSKGNHSPLAERYKSAVNEQHELYGVNEVELQEQQETAHLKTVDKG